MTQSNLRLAVGSTALITTDSWFLAPDGQQYRGVFGRVHSVVSSEQVLGIKANARSTNWYVEIGNMIIAGCQIHFAVACDDCNFSPIDNDDDGKTKRSIIYNAS